jgi:hypothetical protein
MQYKIADNGFKLLLFQVTPGFELTTAESIRAHLQSLRQRGAIGNFQIWLLFGTYDLLVLYEVPSFGPDLLYVGSIPGIEKSNEIFAFAWRRQGGSGRTSTFEFKTISSAPVIGISFQKIHPRHVRKFRARAESAYVHSSLTNPSLHILSTLGWCEFVRFVPEKSIHATFREIHLGTVLPRLRGSTAEETFFIKSFATIGVRYELSSSKAILTNFREPFGARASKASKDATVVQLSLKCHPEHVSTLADSCKDRFKATFTDVVLGRDDLVLDLTESKLPTWGGFISELLRFRRDFSSVVLDSAVQIQGPPTSAPDAVSARFRSTSRRLPLPIFNIAARDADEIRKLGEPVAQAVLASLYSFNSLIAQELIRDCFYDLFRFVNNIAVSARSRSINTFLRVDTERKIERFSFAVDQRAMGVIWDIETANGRASTFRGGIQRVILALNTLPKFIIEQTCGTSWVGFPVIGFDRRFWHRGEIINLPVDRAFKPEAWWGLTHEAAHVLLYLKKEWFPLDGLREIIAKRLGRELSGSEVVDLSEILLDEFDFMFVYRGDWRFYLQTVWSYLVEAMDGDEYVSDRLGSYLLRSFSVLFFSRFPDGDADFRADVPSLRTLYDQLLLSVRKLDRKINRETLLKAADRVLGWFSAYRPALPVVASSVNAYREAFAKLEEPRITRASAKALHEILKGQVADGPLNPIEIILGLARINRVSFPAQIAAILTLWNEYLRTYSDELAFADNGNRT